MHRYRRLLALAPAAAPAAYLHRRPVRSEEGQPVCTKSIDEQIFSAAPPWKREWNHDWDGRHPASGKEYRGKIRHILLIRHGQYELDDPANGLTELGRRQAEITGKRLAVEAAGVQKDVYGEIKIHYSHLVTSTVLRAQQTAGIISAALPETPRLPDDPLLAEGWPLLPLPQGPDFLRDGKVFPADLLEEGPRIEAAFRKYVHRDVDHKKLDVDGSIQLSDGFTPASKNAISPEAAAAAQKEHEFIVIVCHMNVIRYFVARALQIPPEDWLRMRGNNCGITELIVQPSGLVSLGAFADVGHLPIEQKTFH